MSIRITRVLLISGMLLLTLLLFLAPKNAPPVQEKSDRNIETAALGAGMDVYHNLAVKNLEPALAKKYTSLVNAKNYDSLGGFWLELRRPDLAAYQTGLKALKENTSEGYLLAGNRYYYSVQFTRDNTEIPLLYKNARACFEKVLAMEPGNIDAKIMLASTYVEASEDPMRGISLLKEVEKTDSNNVKLQLTFGFFSAKSGQMEKAIQRFNKVLLIDSNYIEAYLHLADAYEQVGDNESTIRSLEAYSARTNDPTARNEISKYIRQLKEKK